MKKNLVLIETLHTGSGLEIIKAALKKSVEIHFITSEYEWFEKNCPSSIADTVKVTIVDWQNTSVRDEFAKLYNKNEKFAIFTQRDGYVEAVAQVAEEFNLNFTSKKAINVARNKEKTREIFLNTPVSSPKFCYVNKREDLIHILKTLSFPFVVKPANGSGSKDVFIIHNESEIILLDRFFDNKNKAHLLLEEFKCGQVVSVETFTNNNSHSILGVTNRLMSNQPYFVELGYAFPCKYEASLQNKLETYSKYILDKLEYKFGFCHIEYILGKDDVYLVEVNARLGGGQLGTLMSKSFNINIYETLIDAMINDREEKINYNSLSTTACACYTVYSPKAGIITSIKGMDIARMFPNVIGVIPGLQVGHYAKETTDMMGHIAQIIAVGETPEKALVTAHSASTSLVIEVK